MVGTVFTTQSRMLSDGVEHRHLRLVLRTATLGSDGHLESVARHQLHVDHRRGVVTGVAARAGRVGQHRAAQQVVGVGVGAAHPFVDHLGDAERPLPAQLHADLQKDVDDAGVLADRAVALCAEA
jgi:hypothetical protein